MSVSDENCDLTQNSELVATFDQRCKGNKSCDFAFDLDLFPTQCRSTDNTAVIIVQCEETSIVVGDYEVSRYNLTRIVVGLDMVIVLGFIVYIILMKMLVHNEVELFDEHHIELMDFSV